MQLTLICELGILLVVGVGRILEGCVQASFPLQPQWVQLSRHRGARALRPLQQHHSHHPGRTEKQWARSTAGHFLINALLIWVPSQQLRNTISTTYQGWGSDGGFIQEQAIRGCIVSEKHQRVTPTVHLRSSPYLKNKLYFVDQFFLHCKIKWKVLSSYANHLLLSDLADKKTQRSYCVPFSCYWLPQSVLLLSWLLNNCCPNTSVLLLQWLKRLF